MSFAHGDVGGQPGPNRVIVREAAKGTGTRAKRRRGQGSLRPCPDSGERLPSGWLTPLGSTRAGAIAAYNMGFPVEAANLILNLTRRRCGTGLSGDWGGFLYKKVSFSIQSLYIIIYHDNLIVYHIVSSSVSSDIT